jgi:hypothetical protein
MENFRITKTRGARLSMAWDAIGDNANAITDWDVVLRDENGKIAGSVAAKVGNVKISPEDTLREIRGLKPATKYSISIRGKGDGFETEEETFYAYTSPRGVEFGYVSNRTQSGVMLQWDASENADMYRIHAVQTGQNYYAMSDKHWVEMDAGTTMDFMIYAVACGLDCVDPPNDAEGRPLELNNVTSIPPSPMNLAVSDLDIPNLDNADARLSWENPSNGYWDSVKVEYSPNDPPAETPTPSYTNNAFYETSSMVKGLYQGTVYTFTVRYVSNNVEGPAETFSYAINDYSENTDKGVKPSGQTCRVPTYLRAENLRVRREIFGNNGNPTMEVTWDHPKAKKPENGYQLVFAPFVPIDEGKPWMIDVDGDTKSYTVDTHQYDPYDEYTVSVIAKHNEYMPGADFATPDFVASHFTGTVTKQQRNTMFVQPDSCCGNVRHNKMDKSCCGGNLITEDELCCKSTPYSVTEFKCCSGGRTVPLYQNC